MPNVVIADTSSFIILNKIGQIDILRLLYGHVTTTRVIALEFIDQLPDWVEIHDVKDKKKLAVLNMQIDKGEASAIALAIDNPGCTLILDDYKARKIADQLNIVYTGTIGVIVKAKLAGHIPFVKPLLEKIKQTNFRLSLEIETQALKEAGE